MYYLLVLEGKDVNNVFSIFTGEQLDEMDILEKEVNMLLCMVPYEVAYVAEDSVFGHWCYNPDIQDDWTVEEIRDRKVYEKAWFIAMSVMCGTEIRKETTVFDAARKLRDRLNSM